MIECERITELNDKPIDSKGQYVLYWMQQSQRSDFNHALEYSIEVANSLGLPVVVCFGLMEDYPEANLRHYYFMLQGLSELEKQLQKREIKFVLRKGVSWQIALELSEAAAVVVADMGYLRFQRQWRAKLARQCKCRVVQVESDAVVPVTTASNKREYTAGTIRNKINSNRDRFLIPLEKNRVKKSSLDIGLAGLDPGDIDKLLGEMDIDRSVGKSQFFDGGSREAERRLRKFIGERLDRYPAERSDPIGECESDLSPYLQFGQISSIYIALEVCKSGGEAVEDFLEQLIVRRELAMNFVWFDEDYDKIACLPGWAKASVNKHKTDKREYLYTIVQFDDAKTHDPYWNAAQLEMKIKGKMHNYMRMYWGKKILEWTKTPEQAWRIALELNNKYEIDGKGPNAYAGVAWCFGNHDRAWAERDVFGKVRYMNAKGLERKFDIAEYVRRVSQLVGE